MEMEKSKIIVLQELYKQIAGIETYYPLIPDLVLYNK